MAEETRARISAFLNSPLFASAPAATAPQLFFPSDTPLEVLQQQGQAQAPARVFPTSRPQTPVLGAAAAAAAVGTLTPGAVAVAAAAAAARLLPGSPAVAAASPLADVLEGLESLSRSAPPTATPAAAAAAAADAGATHRPLSATGGLHTLTEFALRELAAH